MRLSIEGPENSTIKNEMVLLLTGRRTKNIADYKCNFRADFKDIDILGGEVEHFFFWGGVGW